ncbi:MAG TPA: glycosyltransferase family 2 protein, partial [Candidatus Obscuribacterales bacterium]
NGMLSSPFFKPDWSPESFLSRMYTCHFGVYRKSLVDQICGFREGYEGSQDYDLVLRFTELTDKIFHIPKILYHWRIHAESSASVSDQKPYAAIAAEKALLDALSRRGEPGKVMQADCLIGHFIIRYDLKDEPLVSIIIPTRDHGEVLDTCLESIFTKTNYQNFEIILIDNGSVEERALEVIKHWQVKEPGRFKCYPLDIPFNYSKINNFGVSKASGEYLLFLNNDTEVCNADWLHGLLEQAQRDAIGAVGAKLLYPDNTIQHFGVVVGLGGVAGHAHLNLPKESPGYFGLAMTVNNFLAVTGACFMLRKDVFKLVGGFEEKLAVAFNDVDLCLKVHEAGFRNVCLPHVVLYHYESKSRGKDTTPERQKRFQQEVSYMLEKWKKYIEFDPYYNPNLTLINPSHRIDSSGRFLVKS